MSSDDVAIRLRGVDKTYAIYERPHHRLLEAILGRRRRVWHREFRALRGIDLDIRRGETVGLIGRNGSGKSTLLQVVCGILAPTAGEVVVRGRIAALLELGAGFNAEFTGRENVYLNGAVLGLERAEIEERFDAIVAFADIGDFIDQPVKAYSSGMYIRLAFAVAINVDPEILVVDEALSVGDEAFQRKCFARIERIRESGATVLFVSHGAATVAELCDRAILLDAGELLAVGAPKPILSRYHKLLYSPPRDAAAIRERIRSEHAHGAIEAVAPPHHFEATSEPGDGEPEADEGYFDPGLVPVPIDYVAQGAHLEDVRIETPAGRRVNVLRSGARYVYRYTARFARVAALVRFGMMIRTVSGFELGGCASATSTRGIDFVEAGAAVGVRFQFRCLLAPGTYFLNAGVLARQDDEEIFLARRVDAAMFRVLPDAARRATGLVDFEFEPTLEFDAGHAFHDDLPRP